MPNNLTKEFKKIQHANVEGTAMRSSLVKMTMVPPPRPINPLIQASTAGQTRLPPVDRIRTRQSQMKQNFRFIIGHPLKFSDGVEMCFPLKFSVGVAINARKLDTSIFFYESSGAAPIRGDYDCSGACPSGAWDSLHAH